MSSQVREHGVRRSRWAAIGAAVAVSLGAGGIGIVNATISSGPKSVYVPIAPCRLADTRPGGENVGTRAAPLGPRETHTFAVRGNHGRCSIPAGATAIVANVTAVGPSERSFMTIWPSDRQQPTASSLNYVGGQPPFPNAVTVRLSADGRVNVYNQNGSVHVIIDVSGFYEDHNHDDRYFTKAQVDQKLAAIPAGPKGDPGPPGPPGSGPANGSPCTAGLLSGTIVNGFDGAGNATVKCFRNVVTTLAGSTQGSANGVATTAQFNLPSGLAVDAVGNVYVADRSNHRIRKITPAGAVSTFAGSTEGSADGVGGAAQFNQPVDVAVDAAGNVYVADSMNRRIRKITPAGVVTTLAGSTQGFADGVGAAAQFASPAGVAVDAAGNVYVADAGNHRIRKITPVAVVSTLAGSTQGFADGVGAAARFNDPHGVAVDTAGNVFVADLSNHRIRRVTPAGAVSTVAGSTAGFVDGAGATARFNNPIDLAVDAAGNVYVADFSNFRLRKVTPGGLVSTPAGSSSGFSDGVGIAAQFSALRGIAVDAAGTVYVGDGSNHRVRVVN